MYQNAADSGGRGWSDWSLQRRPCQSVLGQASRAFSSMSIAAPNCCQRAVLHNGSISIPPCAMLILTSSSIAHMFFFVHPNVLPPSEGRGALSTFHVYTVMYIKK